MYTLLLKESVRHLLCQSYVNCVDHGVVNKINGAFCICVKKKTFEDSLLNEAVQVFKKQNKMG